MTLLTAFAAISACRFAGGRSAALRQDDSVEESLLPGTAESACLRAMTNAPSALPDDIDALRALILAERAAHAATIQDRDAAHAAVVAERNTLAVERDQLADRNEKLEYIVAEMRRAMYGRRSERIDDDQLALALEALETEHAKTEAQAEKTDPKLKTERTKQRRKSRNDNLDHLPHEEVVVEPASKSCPCCGGALHVIGEDVSKRLDKQPAKLTVIVTKRPKYACRDCEKTGADEVAGIIQAPAPARLIEGGLPTERLVADVVVSKFADHLPLYRQSQILARSGVKIERSTLAHWVGAAAAELQPLHDHLLAGLKASPKLFCDETRCPVLDPGRGETKTGFMWALARDDRPWGGADPPAVAYRYAPGRGGEHAVKLLAGFNGILQVDGYAAYDQLARPMRAGGPVTLAFCWSHLRRKFYELYVGGNQPIATEALARIRQLYDIEADIRGLPPEVRRAQRQTRAKPLVDALKPWLETSLAKVPKGSKLGAALGYGLNQWDGLVRYLDDGRIEIDSNTVERSIRPLALTRKNALFAGHDLGAESWAMIASLIETCKLNAVDPLAWMTDVLTRLVNRWPASKIDELMPWAYAKKPA
jgi:transposase